MRRLAVIVAFTLACGLSLGAAAYDSTAGVAAGGTLRVLHSGSAPTLDPALAAAPLGWGALWYSTCATLYAFRDAPAPAGFDVRPEAAAGPPHISADGRTYTYLVQRGLRFSDGTRLSAANFARGLNRVLNPAMRSEGAELFSDVQRLSANGRRLRIVLRRPSGSLSRRLALAYACPVPIGFPIDAAGVPLLVGSGPYYLARYESGREAVLERNRHYRGSRPRRIDRIVLTIGGDLETVIRAVADGDADVVATELSSATRAELAQRYGVNKGRFRVTHGTSVTALVLNTSRPLFRENARLRRAVNLALDRGAILRAATGWPVTVMPTDQLLTRWTPRFINHRVYPLAGRNLQLARKLAAGNLRGGEAVLWVSPVRGPMDLAEIVVRNLRDIGLEVEVKPLANEVINARASVPGAAYDIDLGTFPVSYPDPGAVIVRFLAGENARKADGNTNYAYFDVPAYNRRIATADRLTGIARWRAFGRLDADLMRREAPWAPLYESGASLFVGADVGCLKMHPVFRIDVGAMCLR